MLLVFVYLVLLKEILFTTLLDYLEVLDIFLKIMQYLLLMNKMILNILEIVYGKLPILIKGYLDVTSVPIICFSVSSSTGIFSGLKKLLLIIPM